MLAASSMDLDQALEFSRYAQRLYTAQPELAARIEARLALPLTWDELDRSALANASNELELAAALRELRQAVVLTTLLRDLTGGADLREVCANVTRLAEIGIRAAVDAHHRWLAHIHGEPIGAESCTPQRLIVVAMGKLGGGELNVSSDVDLVFVYPEDGTTSGPKPLANQEFFERLGRRIIGALAMSRPRASCSASTCGYAHTARVGHSHHLLVRWSNTSSSKGAPGSATHGSRRGRLPGIAARNSSA